MFFQRKATAIGMLKDLLLSSLFFFFSLLLFDYFNFHNISQILLFYFICYEYLGKAPVLWWTGHSEQLRSAWALPPAGKAGEVEEIQHPCHVHTGQGWDSQVNRNWVPESFFISRGKKSPTNAGLQMQIIFTINVVTFQSKQEKHRLQIQHEKILLSATTNI